jgi:hypothetical protein
MKQKNLETILYSTAGVAIMFVSCSLFTCHQRVQGPH